MPSRQHVITDAVMLSEAKHLWLLSLSRRRNDQRFFASLRLTFYDALKWKAPLPSCYGNESSATQA
jgi:hypothetical protein